SGFTPSDGLVLTAIALAAGAEGAPLSNVVASADLINHAVLEPGELADSINRLGRAGLVRRVGEGVALCGAAALHWERFAGKRVYLLKTLERFSALLSRAPASPVVQFEPIGVATTTAAVAAYVALVQAALTAGGRAGA